MSSAMTKARHCLQCNRSIFELVVVPTRWRLLALVRFSALSCVSKIGGISDLSLSSDNPLFRNHRGSNGRIGWFALAILCGYRLGSPENYQGRIHRRRRRRLGHFDFPRQKLSAENW